MLRFWLQSPVEMHCNGETSLLGADADCAAGHDMTAQCGKLHATLRNCTADAYTLLDTSDHPLDTLFQRTTPRSTAHEVTLERHTIFVSKCSEGRGADEEAHKEAGVHELGRPGISTQEVPLGDDAVGPAGHAISD